MNQPQDPIDFKNKVVWYQNSDRYSVDFESVLGMFDRWIQSSTSADSNENDHIASIVLSNARMLFDNQFNIIKGDHILHNLGIQDIPSLDNIPIDKKAFVNLDVKTALQKNLLNYMIQGIPANKESFKFYLSSDSILEIIAFLYNQNRSNGYTQAEVFFNMTFQYFKHVFNEIFREDTLLKKDLVSFIEAYENEKLMKESKHLDENTFKHDMEDKHVNESNELPNNDMN